MEPLKDCCSTCRSFDGDVHCSLPVPMALIRGAILEPDRVVCEEHEMRESDRQDAINHAIAKEQADEERPLYRNEKY